MRQESTFAGILTRGEEEEEEEENLYCRLISMIHENSTFRP